MAPVQKLLKYRNSCQKLRLYLYRNYLYRNYLYRNYLYRNYLYVKRGLRPA